MRECAVIPQVAVVLAVHAGLLFSSCDHCFAADQNAQSIPAYRFKVGDELVYRLTSREDPRRESGRDAKPLDRMEWRIFVVRRNADGSWRLLIHTDIAFLDDSGKVRARRNSLGYCDLQPNGSYVLDERTAVLKRLVPHELFCRLPEDREELETGWNYKPSAWAPTYKFAPAVRTGEILQIRSLAETPYNEMHEWEATTQYDFDVARGVVTRIVDEFKSRGVKQDRRTVELVSIVKHDPKWMDKFNVEAEAYLADYSEWSDRMNDVAWVRTAAACDPLLREARKDLAAARDRSNSEIVRPLYDAHLQEHDEHVKWAVDEAGRRESLFSEAAGFSTDWQVPQLDGGTFWLSEQRGKVVVLDFWSTSCEYCVLAAPQFKQLAAEYEGKDVVFVGVFDRAEEDDKEEARARSLIKSIYGGISHLEGDEIVARYGFSKRGFGYPALLVLDQAGVVREAHIGYTADLPGRLRTILDRMLSNPSG